METARATWLHWKETEWSQYWTSSQDDDHPYTLIPAVETYCQALLNNSINHEAEALMSTYQTLAPLLLRIYTSIHALPHHQLDLDLIEFQGHVSQWIIAAAPALKVKNENGDKFQFHVDLLKYAYNVMQTSVKGSWHKVAIEMSWFVLQQLARIVPCAIGNNSADPNMGRVIVPIESETNASEVHRLLYKCLAESNNKLIAERRGEDHVQQPISCTNTLDQIQKNADLVTILLASLTYGISSVIAEHTLQAKMLAEEIVDALDTIIRQVLIPWQWAELQHVGAKCVSRNVAACRQTSKTVAGLVQKVYEGKDSKSFPTIVQRLKLKHMCCFLELQGIYLSFFSKSNPSAVDETVLENMEAQCHFLHKAILTAERSLEAKPDQSQEIRKAIIEQHEKCWTLLSWLNVRTVQTKLHPAQYYLSLMCTESICAFHDHYLKCLYDMQGARLKEELASRINFLKNECGRADLAKMVKLHYWVLSLCDKEDHVTFAALSDQVDEIVTTCIANIHEGLEPQALQNCRLLLRVMRVMEPLRKVLSAKVPSEYAESDLYAFFKTFTNVVHLGARCSSNYHNKDLHSRFVMARVAQLDTYRLLIERLVKKLATISTIHGESEMEAESLKLQAIVHNMDLVRSEMDNRETWSKWASAVVFNAAVALYKHSVLPVLVEELLLRCLNIATETKAPELQLWKIWTMICICRMKQDDSSLVLDASLNLFQSLSGPTVNYQCSPESIQALGRCLHFVIGKAASDLRDHGSVALESELADKLGRLSITSDTCSDRDVSTFCNEIARQLIEFFRSQDLAVSESCISLTLLVEIANQELKPSKDEVARWSTFQRVLLFNCRQADESSLGLCVSGRFEVLSGNHHTAQGALTRAIQMESQSKEPNCLVLSLAHSWSSISLRIQGDQRKATELIQESLDFWKHVDRSTWQHSMLVVDCLSNLVDSLMSNEQHGISARFLALSPSWTLEIKPPGNIDALDSEQGGLVELIKALSLYRADLAPLTVRALCSHTRYMRKKWNDGNQSLDVKLFAAAITGRLCCDYGMTFQGLKQLGLPANYKNCSGIASNLGLAELLGTQSEISATLGRFAKACLTNMEALKRILVLCKNQGSSLRPDDPNVVNVGGNNILISDHGGTIWVFSLLRSPRAVYAYLCRTLEQQAYSELARENVSEAEYYLVRAVAVAKCLNLTLPTLRLLAIQAVLCVRKHAFEDAYQNIMESESLMVSIDDAAAELDCSSLKAIVTLAEALYTMYILSKPAETKRGEVIQEKAITLYERALCLIEKLQETSKAVTLDINTSEDSNFQLYNSFEMLDVKSSTSSRISKQGRGKKAIAAKNSDLSEPLTDLLELCQTENPPLTRLYATACTRLSALRMDLGETKEADEGFKAVVDLVQSQNLSMSTEQEAMALYGRAMLIWNKQADEFEKYIRYIWSKSELIDATRATTPGKASRSSSKSRKSSSGVESLQQTKPLKAPSATSIGVSKRVIEDIKMVQQHLEMADDACSRSPLMAPEIIRLIRQRRASLLGNVDPWLTCWLLLHATAPQTMEADQQDGENGEFNMHVGLDCNRSESIAQLQGQVQWVRSQKINISHITIDHESRATLFVWSCCWTESLPRLYRMCMPSDFSYSDAIGELDSIIHDVKSSGQVLKDLLSHGQEITSEQKRQWWKSRFALDARMHELLQRMDQHWLHSWSINPVGQGDIADSLSDNCHLFVVDKLLDKFPWECIPRHQRLAISRVLDLSLVGRWSRSFHDGVDALHVDGLCQDNVGYILNPSGDLNATQARFQRHFERLGWHGISGELQIVPHANVHANAHESVNAGESKSVGAQRVSVPELVNVVRKRDVFLYCGHGAGESLLHPTKHLSQLSASEMPRVCMLMGCSSGKLVYRGEYSSLGIALEYLKRGAVCVIGNLWDVTDRDLDWLTADLMARWSGVQIMDGVGGMNPNDDVEEQQQQEEEQEEQEDVNRKESRVSIRKNQKGSRSVSNPSSVCKMTGANAFHGTRGMERMRSEIQRNSSSSVLANKDGRDEAGVCEVSIHRGDACTSDALVLASTQALSISHALMHARHRTKLYYLNAAATIIYGLPNICTKPPSILEPPPRHKQIPQQSSIKPPLPSAQCSRLQANKPVLVVESFPHMSRHRPRIPSPVGWDSLHTTRNLHMAAFQRLCYHHPSSLLL